VLSISFLNLNIFIFQSIITVQPKAHFTKVSADSIFKDVLLISLRGVYPISVQIQSNSIHHLVSLSHFSLLVFMLKFILASDISDICSESIQLICIKALVIANHQFDTICSLFVSS
jgi:hypothetical protein